MGGIARKKSALSGPQYIDLLLVVDNSGSIGAKPFEDSKDATEVRVYTMLTCPCNLGPFTSQFYVVRLGFTGVTFFSYFCSNHSSWVLVRTASPFTHDLYFEQK